MADEPPDEEQPAWMTPEGRLEAVPVKGPLDEGEYTRYEVARLSRYWTDERKGAVAEWIDRGTPKDDVPDFIPIWHQFPESLEEPALDLRGISLITHLKRARSEHDPRPDLSSAHLEHAWLLLVHLEHAILKSARLWHSRLTHAYMQDADLSWADLRHAYLTGTDFTSASLWGTDLRYACLNGAVLFNTDLSDVHLDNTLFSGVEWLDERRRDPDAKLFRGFEVRGLRESDPLFDQWVRQANFIWRCRETWRNPWRALGRRLWPDAEEEDTIGNIAAARLEPNTLRGKRAARIHAWPPPLWLLWKVTCDCGRSFLRWAVWCLGFAVLFGFIFWLGGVVEVPGPSETGRQPNALTYFYFSIVTFTTLGFGDVTPTGNAGEIWVMLEVILGYVGLGGLISIFTTKLIPPR